MSATPQWSTIDPTTWEYSELKQVPSGGYVVYVNNKDGTPIRLQIGDPRDTKKRLRAPFGHQRTAREGTPCNENKRNLLLQFYDSDELTEFWKSVDAHNVSWAFQNCKKLFGVDIDEATLKSVLYKDCLIHNNPDYPPCVRAKIILEGRNATNFFTWGTDASGADIYTPATAGDLERGMNGVVILRTPGLWFMSKQFGMSLTATDILMFPKATSMRGAFNWGDDASAPRFVATVMDETADDEEDPVENSDFVHEIRGGAPNYEM